MSYFCCPIENCDGLLKREQTGTHMDTRVSKLKCDKCGHLCCSVQFIAPIEVMKFVNFTNKNGNRSSAPRLRHPITVDLDPNLGPEIKIW